MAVVNFFKYIITDIKVYFLDNFFIYIGIGIAFALLMIFIRNYWHRIKRSDQDIKKSVVKRKYVKQFITDLLLGSYLSVLIWAAILSRPKNSRVSVDFFGFGFLLSLNPHNISFVIENIVMFMPFGFLLPSVLKKINSVPKAAIFGFCASLVLETTQLITGRGFFEVADILNNTVGFVLGYILLLLLRKIKRQKETD